jgi:hypothetical protein
MPVIKQNPQEKIPPQGPAAALMLPLAGSFLGLASPIRIRDCPHNAFQREDFRRLILHRLSARWARIHWSGYVLHDAILRSLKFKLHAEERIVARLH